ncbi:hypothetical protein BJ878DRAFT_204102 [Calycina marina]|uniref:N-acetyltransferase domain-containing protein n=1 Tax=Calycina marina TaxID=1763456 RepID=A0A9P8CE24_9HELO|nr:hypothetical protein BJ878DRAFT_204102 [Calycina marina]
MDSSSAKPPNTRLGQASIRAFFQPRTPQYATPPATTVSSPLSPPPPPILSSFAKLIPTSISVDNDDQIRDNEDGVIIEPSHYPAPTPSPHAQIWPIEQENILPLRRINSLLLEIAYPDSFYKNILTSSHSFSRVIIWNQTSSTVIGGIVCRIDPAFSSGADGKSIAVEGNHDIYLQSLALLSPYRGKGLAAAALQDVVTYAARQDKINIRQLYAHVWTKNEDGLKWYASRGFMRDEHIIPGYYSRLNPDTAYLLRRPLKPSDHMAAQVSVPATEQNNALRPEEKAREGDLQVRPGGMIHTKSFQDRRPDMEWNDLPQDVLRTSILKPTSDAGVANSGSSSRSGVEGKSVKKKRQYPAAAFNA